MLDELDVPTGLAETQPIREIIFDYLRVAILDKKLKSGAKMVEREVAERFNVSRTPVREAFQRLESEGFLERNHGKSYLVRSIAYEEMQEAYMLRLTLEPLMVAACIDHINQEEMHKLEQILDVAEKLHAEGNHTQVSSKLIEFDSVLMQTARLKKLKAILSDLMTDLRRFRRSNLSDKKRRIDAVQEHRKILEAIIAKDKEQAKAYTRTHIQNSFDRINQATQHSD